METEAVLVSPKSLHQVCSDGDVEGLKFLLDRGANPNTRGDWDRSTPLMAALLEGHRDIIKMLLEHPDIDVNVRDLQGFTALHSCVYRGDSVSLAQMLAMPSLSVLNSREGDGGETALMIAINEGHTECVRLIVSDPSCQFGVMDHEGKTAEDWAREAGHPEIIAILREAAKGGSGGG